MTHSFLERIEGMAIDAFDYAKKLLDGTGASADRAYNYHANLMRALGEPAVIRCSDDPTAALELIAALTFLVRMFAQQHMDDPAFIKGFNLIGTRG